MNIACLDTESTSTGLMNEILELSILDGQGHLVHNQLYKPKIIKKWHYAERVHGISPAMVADKPFFSLHVDRVQKIFNDSVMLLGFAIDNDIRVLQRYGFEGLEKKSMDVRDLYWAVFRDEPDVDYYHIPRLVVCAEKCGYVWREGSAHSAAADAEATLFCFNTLLPEYAKKYNLFEVSSVEAFNDEQINTIWKHLRGLIMQEHHRKAVEKARGMLYLVNTDAGYAIYARKHPLSNDDMERFKEKKRQIISCIELADSQKGYEELLARFAPKIIGGENYYKSFYDLNDDDVELFRNYTNVFIDDKYICNQ
ncbi:MAG: 3'-5' exonuclease [Anaerovibrio sp.]|uniref:3'-5' exonuclease n=1 Tax=Anaerovibrio sp. TaxID=1872532 RepID=UPI0025E159F7|nr:3'-5' exonuclease [Anaerovibrio sp.]MCR5177155.1 3'-5' exonuclease [Anaerovibrio sp.]